MIDFIDLFFLTSSLKAVYSFSFNQFFNPPKTKNTIFYGVFLMI